MHASKQVKQERVGLVAWDISHVWLTRAVVKSDKEPAIKALAGRARYMRSHPAITEESPEYETKPNGLAEHDVHMIKWLLNTA